MSSSLDIHRASKQETGHAHANVFGFWSKAETLDEHVEYLSTASPYRRAEWFVGCRGSRVVTSLAAYPYEFQVRGEVVPGIAIASVFTVADCRRQGLAERLIREVEANYASRQMGLSMLYSDIDPNYYGQLGYIACPSHSGWCDLPVPAGSTLGGAIELVRFDPQQQRRELAESYARYHSQRPLCVVRNDEYWSAILEKSPGDEFYWLSIADNERAGYLRVRVASGRCQLRDYALSDSKPETAARLYEALLSTALERGLRQCGGWLPDNEAARARFPIEPRKVEITMIKPLAWQGELSPEIIAAADDFCEIDHV